MKITTIKRYLKHLQLLISLLMTIVIILLLIGIFCLSTFKWRVHMSDIPKQISVHPLDDTTVNGIPLIIHQTWKTNEVPEKWKEPQESWTNQSVIYPLKRRYNEFVYMLWTDEMLDKFIKEQYPWFYKTFNSYPFPISKTDAGRYFLLYHYGGIYSDLDIGCNNQSIRRILANIEENQGVSVMEVKPYGFSLEVIISAKGHPFMRSIIAGLKPAQTRYPIPYLTVLLSTGPLYMTAKYGLYKNKDEIQIVSPKLYEGKYFKHYHGGSWHSWDGDIIWWFYNHGPLFVKLIILAVFILCIMTVNNYYKGKNKKIAIV